MVIKIIEVDIFGAIIIFIKASVVIIMVESFKLVKDIAIPRVTVNMFKKVQVVKVMLFTSLVLVDIINFITVITVSKVKVFIIDSLVIKYYIIVLPIKA